MDNAKKNEMNAVETAQFYEHRWAKAKHRLIYPERFRIDFIRDHIRGFIGRSDIAILDFGCGRGWMAQFLSAFGSVTGIDFSASSIKFAQENYGQYGQFVLADPKLPQLGLSGSGAFDLVVCSEVIEHVPDHLALLRQINELLKPGGWFILTTPNGHIWPQYKAANLFMNRILKLPLSFQPVENWVSPDQLIGFFQKLNFQVHCHEGQTFYRFGISPLMPLGWVEWQIVDVFLRALGLHHRYARRILPVALYQLVVAQKAA